MEKGADPAARCPCPRSPPPQSSDKLEQSKLAVTRRKLGLGEPFCSGRPALALARSTCRVRWVAPRLAGSWRLVSSISASASRLARAVGTNTATPASICLKPAISFKCFLDSQAPGSALIASTEGSQPRCSSSEQAGTFCRCLGGRALEGMNGHCGGTSHRTMRRNKAHAISPCLGQAVISRHLSRFASGDTATYVHGQVYPK